jgi:hypothetical protein
MKKLFLVLSIVTLVACNMVTPQPILISRVDTVKVSPQPIIPTDTTKAWPIRVISVERNTDRDIDMAWQVTTENGIMYYTNKKPQIGDVAFCLSIDEEIVDCDCEK